MAHKRHTEGNGGDFAYSDSRVSELRRRFFQFILDEIPTAEQGLISNVVPAYDDVWNSSLIGSKKLLLAWNDLSYLTPHHDTRMWRLRDSVAQWVKRYRLSEDYFIPMIDVPYLQDRLCGTCWAYTWVLQTVAKYSDPDGVGASLPYDCPVYPAIPIEDRTVRFLDYTVDLTVTSRKAAKEYILKQLEIELDIQLNQHEERLRQDGQKTKFEKTLDRDLKWLVMSHVKGHTALQIQETVHKNPDRQPSLLVVEKQLSSRAKEIGLDRKKK